MPALKIALPPGQVSTGGVCPLKGAQTLSYGGPQHPPSAASAEVRIVTLIDWLIGFAISFLIKWVFLTLVFYAAGRIVSGVNAKFTDALLVAFIGALVSEILHFGFQYLIYVVMPSLSGFFWLPPVGSALITLIVYIPLFMHFFDTGLGGALLIGLLCVFFYILIGVAMFFLLLFLGWI